MILKLLLNILIPVVLGSLIGYMSASNSGAIYDSLTAPPLNPPGITFSVVWPILYGLMGLAHYFVTKEEKMPNIRTIYVIQLLFNYAWTFLFFSLALRGIAAVEILILIVLIIVMMRRFKKISKISFWLLLPYLLWTLFALYLNAGYWLLN
ncbi:TspO and MBR related proteins [Salinicoccus halodurans]|uniref:TspO and MBR related proteins n=1 Tax=Salinicoccus halodurans TaxID=407035 RepID=A0A0F7HJ88_9STAP|nr:TspO/MBR family protein [Salinicoccus halodurans]AKG73117.1 hypothetical protein AAT16_02135 [Salinicoccus halodurans]SFK85272.1 TspO and MBR related proteins [Salinicoccus halodurans]